MYLCGRALNTARFPSSVSGGCHLEVNVWLNYDVLVLGGGQNDYI